MTLAQEIHHTGYQGILFDLEGVIYQDGRPIGGASETVMRLDLAGYKIRFLTNTTTAPRSAILARLQDMDLPVKEHQIFTPPLAAAALLKSQGIRSIHLAADSALSEDFQDFDLVGDAPQAVILGDLATGFTWDRLNALFHMLHQGAQLITLHANRYCRRGDAIALDLGPFSVALEYAAGVEAAVVGKPNPAFFELALKDMGLPADQALMVGDDLESDIGGAIGAGMEAVQVETGKFLESDRDHPSLQPTGRIPTIKALPKWLGL